MTDPRPHPIGLHAPASTGSRNSYSYNAANQTTSITPSGGSAVSMTYLDQGQADRATKGTLP